MDLEQVKLRITMYHARPKHKISIAHVYMETLEDSTESREEFNKARSLQETSVFNGL